ncbi:MAG: carboxynorspermidine decarboxylase [Mariprofundaceae bacterium]|nr:carboxynorspermidine decarboxylase [Mariprofundaceae bacterium]
MLKLPSPCYVLEASKLLDNLKVFEHIQHNTGCKIILALKGFAMWGAFDLMRPYLHGATASSLHEAMLAKEFGREVHVYAPAYKESEFSQLMALADHITFNSVSNWQRFQQDIAQSSKYTACALRINPEISEVSTALYNPCARGSRLGIVADQMPESIEEIEGFHVHALCGSDDQALARLLQAIEEKFSHWLPHIKWLNLGGGHHITRQGYDVAHLIQLLNAFSQKHQVQLYLEPGEAVGWQTGYLTSTVLDVVHNDVDIAILDTSAAAHMPDCLEMPYRPDVRGAKEVGVLAHDYRLGGASCLAGDVMGDYSFAQPLEVGQSIIFEDMIHYTFVKNNTFNGIQLPALAIQDLDGHMNILRQFSYDDYKYRLS